MSILVGNQRDVQQQAGVNLRPIYVAIGGFLILGALLGQTRLWEAYLTWLSTARGAIIQATVYVAQSVILLYVLITALRQFNVSALQTQTSRAELATLQKSVNAATLQNTIAAHRGIMEIAIARPEILSRLYEEEGVEEAEIRVQAFADILINHAYNAYLQYTLSVLAEGIWDTLRPGVLNVFQIPYVRKRWSVVKSNYRQDFVDLVR